MLSASRQKQLEDQVTSYSREEMIWLNGYLTGRLHDEKPASVTDRPLPVSKKITIAYGTESGNSKKLASDFAGRAKKLGVTARVVALDQYRLNDLQKEEYFFTILSTQGEGDPPATARKFYDHIHKNGFQLGQLKYGVLALGDTSYPLFCKAGEDVDQQLQKLGGQRIIPLQKCDTDFGTEADTWFTHVLEQLLEKNNDGITNMLLHREIAINVKPAHKKNYKGSVLTSINLNDKGSQKETYHIEIAAEGLDYLPGDSIGIFPKNPERNVMAIMELAGICTEDIFMYNGSATQAFVLLQEKLNICYLPLRVIRKYALLVNQDIPDTRMGLEDLLRIFPLQHSKQFQQLLEILEPHTPRLYSICSAPSVHENEVHILVSRNRFMHQDEMHYGLCSNYLSQFREGEPIEFYVHPNHLFRLPELHRDIIMIGPGTGIAPFRSFIFQRDSSGGTGRNWLFFGEQHFHTDFLYQTEWQQWRESGMLHQLDVAFSRDQEARVYVQDKIRKNGDEFYRWLENDAVVYVCGSRAPMSRDVEEAIVQVISEHGQKNNDESLSYLAALKDAGRYHTDVY